jgi:hypothetical protein
MTKTNKPVPAVNVKPLTLTKSDIRAFENAVARRVGRPAYDDWRVISGIYMKAWRIAAAKVDGDTSHHNPLVKKEFGLIIAGLQPISDSEGTTRIYRAALLNIERAEPDFSTWYDKHQPRASNPLDLWNAYKAKPTKTVSADKDRVFSEHQQQMAQVQQDAADKISAQQDEIDELRHQVRALGGDPTAVSSVEELLWRAWDLQAGRMAPEDNLDELLGILVAIARAAGVDAERVRESLELALTDVNEEEEADTDDAA